MVAQSLDTQPPARLQPSVEETAFFDHRFRFLDRENPVISMLYTLALQWNVGTNYPKAPSKAESTPLSLPPIEPLDIVQFEVRLPPLPAVMLKLQEILRSRNFSADQVADVIAKDPGLTAWLLKLVNSPYYGFTAKISTISRAVALVGTRQIQTLAIGGALNSLSVLLPKGLINMELFWRHSIAVGIAAQEIWRISGRPDGEQIFVAGLLHDCGQLAMAYAAPQVVSALNKSYSEDSDPTCMMEKGVVDFDHAKLGGMLLHRWNMPLPLVIAVLRHHTVDEPTRYPEAAAVHIADILVTSLGITLRPMPAVPQFSQEAWNALGISPQALSDATDVLKSKLDDICSDLRI